MDDLIKLTTWKIEEGIVMPNSMVKISAASVAIGTYITHEEIFGDLYTMDKLKNDLSSLYSEDCIVVISHLLTILENEGYTSEQTQHGLMDAIFSDILKDKLLSLWKKDTKRLVLFEAQLLVLAKYAITFCKKGRGNDFDNRLSYPIFQRTVIGITDLLTENHSEDDWTKDMLRSHTIQNLYFTGKDDFRNSIGRIESLFIDLPKEFTSHHSFLNVEELFKEATNLSLQNYLYLGFSLIIFLVQQNASHIEESHWSIDPNALFAESTLDKKEISNLFEAFSIEISKLSNSFNKKTELLYDFSGFVKRPLITFDNQIYFPLGLRYLKEKIFLQVYWVLFDHVRHDAVLLNRYTSFMGYLFERYVSNLLRRIFPKPKSSIVTDRLIVDIEYKVGIQTKRSTDNIVINPNSLILIETKVSQLQVYKTGIIGDLDAFRADINKIIIEAYEQIAKFIIDFEKGFIKEMPDPSNIKIYYPVIVVYGKLSSFPLLWDIVKEEAQKSSFYDEKLFANLQIIEIGELERLEPVLYASGQSLEQLLHDKIHDKVYRYLPMKNYLYYVHSSYRDHKNAFLESKYNDFISRMTFAVLGQELPQSDNKKP